jgi:hypothetical protein
LRQVTTLLYFAPLLALGAIIYWMTSRMAAKVNQHLPAEERIGLRKGRGYITGSELSRLRKFHKQFYPESVATRWLTICEILLAFYFLLFGVRVVFFPQ